jgi:hypothetical protein
LGLSQPLSRQRVFPSPQKQGGGGTLACGWGVGESPNSDEGHTLWYSLYVRTLCTTESQTHECGNWDCGAAQFLFWEYLFPISVIHSLQCVVTYLAQKFTI